jgi:hypothetical protein
MSVVQNRTPEGGHRGIVFARSGGDDVFEAGTVTLEWNLAKELPLGPKGQKGVICSSDAKTEVPSLVCAVTTKRGGGS